MQSRNYIIQKNINNIVHNNEILFFFVSHKVVIIEEVIKIIEEVPMNRSFVCC